MRKFFYSSGIKVNVQSGEEILHCIEINGIKISLEQKLIFHNRERYFSFYVIIRKGKDYNCVVGIYDRADAWKEYKEQVTKVFFPF